ncbi:hypothetical protein PoB_000132100 [Plakobranchus ocellatus]|uniref:Uncharacterized protein n=1 Tax=Plakobranchus ocellatus TaxID=259542 RepID=A0AAV3XXL1_9GAST|nr:hypothetical protein PoB_000132100 [Plakobranchus ocellatus]
MFSFGAIKAKVVRCISLVENSRSCNSRTSSSSNSSISNCSSRSNSSNSINKTSSNSRISNCSSSSNSNNSSSKTSSKSSSNSSNSSNKTSSKGRISNCSSSSNSNNSSSKTSSKSSSNSIIAAVAATATTVAAKPVARAAATAAIVAIKPVARAAATAAIVATKPVATNPAVAEATVAAKVFLGDEPKSGRPKTSTNEENTTRADELIRCDRRMKICEIALKLKIPKSTIHEIVHDTLGYRKLSARWVPKMLTEDHKLQRVEISQRLLQRCQQDN